MSRLFFVINQNPIDGSAHALYCVRNCWWLAKVKHAAEVHLVFPGPRITEKVLESHHFPPVPNLRLVGLPAIRKDLGYPFTINSRFYRQALNYIGGNSQAGDILISASFQKLFSWLLDHPSCKSLRTTYEVHQLAMLDREQPRSKSREELKLLEKVRSIVVTTEPLKELVEKYLPGKKVANLGLGCGFNPAQFIHTPTPKTHKVVAGYIGSLYREQGVEWLLDCWHQLQLSVIRPLVLDIYGGNKTQIKTLKKLIQKKRLAGINLHGRISPQQLPEIVSTLDLLVIPSLPEGRMPYVALTKVYDYLAFGKVIIAPDFPSIREVIQNGKDGLLFRAGDYSALAAALNQALSKGFPWESIIQNQRISARKFSWEERAFKYWNLLDHTGPTSGT